MTATETVRNALGSALDVDRIHITVHAIQRYLGRRNTRDQSWEHAEFQLRRLLGCASTQRPPVVVRAGRASRLYRAGGFMLVTTADHTALVTVYPITRPVLHPRRTNRGRGREARRVDETQWSEDDE
jgi:hypothetical protein